MGLFGKKKILDEREKLESYKTGYYAFWFMFWALAGGSLFQSVWLNAPFSQYACELFILIAAGAGTVIADVRRGNYDNFSEPGWRSYLAYSLIFAILFTVVVMIGNWHQGWLRQMKDVCIAGVANFVFLFMLIYVSLALMGWLVKRRRRKLEKEFDD